MTKRLGELLVTAHIITQFQLDTATTIQATSNRRLGAILIKLGYITEDTLIDFLAKQQHHFTTTDYIRVDDEVKRIIPKYLCKKFGCVQLSLNDNVINLAMVNTLDEYAITYIEEYTHKVVNPMLASNTRINEAISTLPFSYKDIFNQDNIRRISLSLVVMIAFLLVVASIKYSAIVHDIKYGSTVTEDDGTVHYSNKDIFIKKLPDGHFVLLGRGAYTNGQYNIEFKDAQLLRQFIKESSGKFSSEQKTYIETVLNK